jgi:hypothetical protein
MRPTIVPSRSFRGEGRGLLSGVSRCAGFFGLRSHILRGGGVAGVLLLAGVAGALALAGPAAPARAQEPEPTTTAPPPEPTPDPAPAPAAPKPKPKAKAATPAPRQQPVRRPRSAYVPRTSTASSSSPSPVRPATTSRPRPQPRAKKKPAAPPKRKVVVTRKPRKPAPTLSEIVSSFPPAPPTEVRGGVLGAAVTAAGSSGGIEVLLIEAMLLLAVGSFGLAVIPAARVRWQPLSSFVLHRHVDMTVLGFVFLVIAAFALLLRGSH